MAFDSTQIVELVRQNACEHLAGIVLDPDGFRESLSNMDTPTLSGNFTTLQALFDILTAQSPSSADLALPTLSDLAGICQVEAAQRGQVLHQGDEQHGSLVARLVAERLLDRPLPDGGSAIPARH